MKNLLNLLFAVLILFFMSCTKDTNTYENPANSCSNVTCLNGGTCNNGSCICPPGYEGEQCENIIDPCANITCNNGGTCVDGTCDCQFPYWGTSCTNIYPPSDVRVSEIRVLKYSLVDAYGQYWTGNPNNFPDLRPVIKRTDYDSDILWGLPTIIDANPNTTHTWVVNPPKSIKYTYITGDMGVPDLWLFHNMPNYSELMYSIWLKPANQYPLSGIPITTDGKQIHTLGSQNGQWKFEVVLQYVW